MSGESIRNVAVAKIKELDDEHVALLTGSPAASEAQLRHWQGVIAGLRLSVEAIDLAYRENK